MFPAAVAVAVAVREGGAGCGLRCGAGEEVVAAGEGPAEEGGGGELRPGAPTGGIRPGRSKTAALRTSRTPYQASRTASSVAPAHTAA